jgi:pimeloyl-ACP methyl ester carboxylesterase
MPVHVIAHSAGCAVALSAAESVPVNSLARLVLLAPSVSEGYDLRPALAGAAGGIDAFISDRDRFWLGFGTGLVGTSDGLRQAAAGRVGFDPPADALAERLRQHPWDASVAWTGNAGGHADTLRQAYLRAYVFPLLLSR